MKLSAAKFTALAFLGASLAACGGSPANEADQSQQAVTASTCDQYGIIDQGEYKIQNDEWNSTLTQCISSTGANFTVTTANFNMPNGSPASYPSIYKGCHWGNCTAAATAGMPVQVSGLGSASSSVSFTIPSGYNYDAAYDVWFNSTSTTSGQPNGAEVMIWVSHGGFPQPIGSQVATVTIGNASWNVWFGNIGWNVISYVRASTATSASLDIKAFTNDAVSRGYIQTSWWLIAIECGFEIWTGGQGLAVNSFSASVSGGGGGGGGTCSSAPSAPSGLTASAASSSQINLSWSGVSAPANCSVTYSVFRNGSQVASGLTGTTYSDTGLSASTTYSYYVRAVDSAGSSGNSSTVSATTQASGGGGGGTGSCTATISPASSWSGGFTANVTVKAGSTAISAWTVTLNLGSNTITDVWNASRSGSTFKNISSNGSLAAGASTSFGFQGSCSGTCTLPTVASCTSP